MLVCSRTTCRLFTPTLTRFGFKSSWYRGCGSEGPGIPEDEVLEVLEFELEFEEEMGNELLEFGFRFGLDWWRTGIFGGW